ncbi:MAG: phosphoenolpyruvate carboxykinase (ATP) [Anaerolineales bacterium]
MTNNLLNIKTPAQAEAGVLKCDYGLENHGLTDLNTIYWNLATESLYEEITFRGEGHITYQGAIAVSSGKHTARAANDKYIVREPSTEEDIWWGEYNRPYDGKKFNELYNRMLGFVQGRDIFVQDCYVVADPEYRVPIRIITEYAWHSLFARNMFLLPQSAEEYRQHIPSFTLVAVPSFKAIESIDGTNSETFIGLNYGQNLAIVGSSAYGGEIKKSIFTVLNYLLPLQGVMPMHCSANVSPEGDAALFFGLSGTGKTTLSADTTRSLIGDDEHGWSDEGIFNFEGGCYAKVIRLSSSAEPEIYAATQRFGTILENVVYDSTTRKIDLDDNEHTENTRASYPLTYIENAVPEKMAGHPKNIVLLTCDASGVMPPIAKLSPNQALYQFVSGYTAKVGGTEVGVGDAPEITFSTCFGAPFMVHHPSRYAELLRGKIERHGVNTWLLNTGWVGGPFGVGERISISYTRALLNAALSGELLDVEYKKDPIFGFEVPVTCEGVPADILDPSSSWPSKEEYQEKYRQLASRFIDNFTKFAPEFPPEVRDSGPVI